jgi:outer membrane biosynthesis protein TonB
MATLLRLRAALLLVVVLMMGGCLDQETSQKVAKALQNATTKPDELPKMLNGELPFHYPPALYARKVQGNVTLYLYIDRNGQVTPDSTRIEESSGYAGLDSAAV